MSKDQETISVYDREVDNYVKMVDFDKPGSTLETFIKHIPENGLVLDLGCGPANSSVWMRKAGLKVDPVDASPEMVRLANEKHAIDARVATFDDLDAHNLYDGIWANFSLLHATREAFPGHLSQINDALKRDGIFHIGMKLGDAEKRDRLGRFYTYYGDGELLDFLAGAGFEVLETKRGEEKGLAGDIDPWMTILSKTSKN